MFTDERNCSLQQVNEKKYLEQKNLMLKKLVILFLNYTFISLLDLPKIAHGHLSVWVTKGKPYSKILLTKTIIKIKKVFLR